MMNAAEIAEQRKQNTELWMAEYKNRKLLFSNYNEVMKTIDEDLTNKGHVDLSAPAPFDKAPAKRGEVRLLADIHEYKGLPRFQYVYVHRSREDGQVLVIPISSYSRPASELELLMADDALGHDQRVLQIWNTRTIGSEFIERSWISGTVELATQQEASIMLGYYWLGESLKALGDAQARLGMSYENATKDMLKLVREYMNDELAVFADIDAADMARLDGYEEKEA